MTGSLSLSNFCLGWIATRSGGHYATRFTHIDDFVESVRIVTPTGVVETPRLPASGAGALFMIVRLFDSHTLGTLVLIHT